MRAQSEQSVQASLDKDGGDTYPQADIKEFPEVRVYSSFAYYMSAKHDVNRPAQK